MSAPPPAAQSRPAGWSRRYNVVALCFAGTFICYIDRVNISVAIIPMQEEFQWSLATQGLVLSSFFWGYMATQILGGWLADRLGGKVVLGTAVLTWSIFTLLTPPAAASLALLFAVRVGMGVGEGVAFPATYTVIANWIPVPERTRCIALIGSGIPLGTVAALVLCPWIIERWGWPMAFTSFGLVGFVWYALWHVGAASSPEKSASIEPAELRYIQDHRPPMQGPARLSWRTLLSHSSTWAIIVGHFANNWGIYVILTWLPTYFVQELGVDLSEVGFYTVLPWLTMFVCNNLVGWLADGMLNRGMPVTRVRKLMQSVGFCGPAAFLLLIGNVPSPLYAAACISAVLGLAAFSLAGYGVNHLDIGPRYAGVLLGFSNTAGTVPGIVGVAATGWILETTGSWAAVFALTAAVYAVGLVFFLAFASGERQFD